MILEKDFSVKPSLAALWKNLQKCSKQGLISVEKIGRSNFCKITEKGKKRRGIIAARKFEEFNEWVSRPSGDEQQEQVQVSQQKPTSSALAKRAFEVESSLMLCNAVLRSDRTQNILNFAQTLMSYWQKQRSEVIPCVAEELARLIVKFSEQYAELIDKMLKQMFH